MKKYIGVKIVEAEPMTLGDYNIFKGWTIPENEDPATEGYKVIHSDNYVTWCPKEQFEIANRPINAMTFGHAVEALKAGKKVARRGWNGKGMWLGLVSDTWAINFEVDGDIQKFENHPYIVMKTVDGKIVPWLASQTDVLAEDWMIVE